jgi:hypothetical protein
MSGLGSAIRSQKLEGALGCAVTEWVQLGKHSNGAGTDIAARVDRDSVLGNSRINCRLP